MARRQRPSWNYSHRRREHWLHPPPSLVAGAAVVAGQWPQHRRRSRLLRPATIRMTSSSRSCGAYMEGKGEERGQGGIGGGSHWRWCVWAPLGYFSCGGELSSLSRSYSTNYLFKPLPLINNYIYSFFYNFLVKMTLLNFYGRRLTKMAIFNIFENNIFRSCIYTRAIFNIQVMHI